MNQPDTAHAWWSRLRHQGLLLSPVVMLERYPQAPEKAAFYQIKKLRDAFTRFCSRADTSRDGSELDKAAILFWTDALLEEYVGQSNARFARQGSIPEKLTAVVRMGSRTETLRPHRVVFADDESKTPALLVMADTSPHVGRGRGRTAYARFLELLRGTGHRLGLLTNGHQFRLIYAGLDFESWCEWEADRWFDDGQGTEELDGLKQLVSPASLGVDRGTTPAFLDAVEESRKRQADLSSVLRENVRQAVEVILEEVSATNRGNTELFAALMAAASERPLTDTEAHEALLQATVRVVMRLVVCLFAESRQLLPINDPVYGRSYGVRSLYELLEESARHEGGTHSLLNRPFDLAWPRLMALFRLIHGGSIHGAFPMRAYSGALFRPGNTNDDDPVSRALFILEHSIRVRDATIHSVLRKLVRGPLPVMRGRTKTFVEGPVDYTDLRTEFIGLIYEGLLDYKVKRTDEKIGPQVFLNLGREPVLPLSRLDDMLKNDKKGLKDLLTKLKKEKVTASVASAEEEEEAEEEGEQEDEAETEAAEPEVEVEAATSGAGVHGGDYLDAVESAKRWAREAVVLAGLVGKQKAREPDTEYQARIDAEATRLINRVVATGEFYLVRAGNTRKGTGTFYTRPQLAVPTVHRTLEPLCYDKAKDGTLVPKTPEVILGLKVCDPACGSASFLVAALHYLTEALFRSLCYHCKLEDPEEAKKLTLPYGRPRTGQEGEELVPLPPDDPQRGETFTDRVKALLRRHVVERCIYGVDINPLAVEFARVSLWIETLDPELPFTFLDHKIKIGNSLVGCWLDRVLDYPLKAWERNGGDDPDDKHEGPRTDRLKTYLKGPKQANNRRPGDGRIKKEMRAVIETHFKNLPSLFPDGTTLMDNVVAEAQKEYEWVHSLPIGDPDARERFYREHMTLSKPLQHLKRAMDEWCAIWFWPADPESMANVPTPLDFHKPSKERTKIIEHLASEVKFFHWELEFPDVFTPKRSGFDAMIGNPPWDVMKPNSQEFFSDPDPLYRTYDKQAALRKQKELFASVPKLDEQWGEYTARFKALGNWASNTAEPFDLSLARGKAGQSLQAAWSKYRTNRACFADPQHPFHLQGSADLNSYKMFTEVFWNLLRHDGRLGVLLPTGIYSDFGTKSLREELLLRGRLDFLYAFQNEKKIFTAADHRYTQTVVLATRGGATQTFRTRFRMGVGDSPQAHEIPDDILRNDHAAMVFTPDDVKTNSPKTLSMVELKTQKDLAIFRRIYRHSIRIGDNAPGWEITYTCEFHMTNDSKHFASREKLEAMGYKPDLFGRWLGPEGDLALPLYQGRVVHHFDFWAGRYLHGAGRNARWTNNPHDQKVFSPQYLMSEQTYRKEVEHPASVRIGLRDVARSTDTRTLIAACIPPFPGNHKLPILEVGKRGLVETTILAATLSSCVFDWVTRIRLGGTSIVWSVLAECPLPMLCSTNPCERQVILNAARLTFLHRRFALEWLKLKSLYPDLAKKQWKQWWAVTEADRLRLRVEIDSLCADLYSLEPDDFDWIVRDDPTDPKGFYRVDRQLPFRERLTGLAAAAFRALKEGKWSVESAAKLSNDEFFEIIGIPELTSTEAAKAKNLPEPLIRKRDGCHRWKPEEFGPDDPRHGWTWDDCWKDAVALLGSDQAVKDYIEGKHEKPKDVEQGDGKKDMFGEELPPKQKRLF